MGNLAIVFISRVMYQSDANKRTQCIVADHTQGRIIWGDAGGVRTPLKFSSTPAIKNSKTGAHWTLLLL